MVVFALCKNTKSGGFPRLMGNAAALLRFLHFLHALLHILSGKIFFPPKKKSIRHGVAWFLDQFRLRRFRLRFRMLPGVVLARVGQMMRPPGASGEIFDA